MKRSFALTLALVLILSLAGCAKPGGHTTDVPAMGPAGGEDPGAGPQGEDRDPAENKDPQTPGGAGEDRDPSDTPSGEGGLRLGLMDDAAALGAVGLYGNGAYRLVTGVTDPEKLLTTGELDAVILPVSEASRIYASTDGAVQIAALTASGGWGIVERGSAVHDIWALAQKTVYVPAASPEAEELFRFIAARYGFEIGDTLKLEPVGEAVLASKDLSLMPAALAGRTIVRDADTHIALKLGEEWTEVTDRPILPAGCLLVRSGIAEADLKTLLDDLKSSQESVSDHLDAAVSLGLADSQEEAWAALECCTFVWVTGADALREELADYLSTLYSIDPALVGGFIPDDGFYR